MCGPITIPALTKVFGLIAAGKTAYDAVQDTFNDPADNRAPTQTNAPGVARKQVQQAAEVPEEDKDKKKKLDLQKTEAQEQSTRRKQLGLSQLDAIMSEDPSYVGLTTPPETKPQGLNLGSLYAPPAETR
tara:strand:- start:2938 stop:3327 length:390 start_codon:yes stop_codon:yes gene_type:complete